MPILLSAALVAALSTGQRQPDLSDWWRVSLIKPGTELLVETVDRKGRWRLRDVTDRELIVATKDDPPVLLQIPRTDVRQVSVRKRQGSGWGALAGLIAGISVGFRTGVALGFKQCGSSCSDEGALMLLSLIGVPAAAAWAGHHLAGRTKEVVVFRQIVTSSRAAPISQWRSREGKGWIPMTS